MLRMAMDSDHNALTIDRIPQCAVDGGMRTKASGQKKVYRLLKRLAALGSVNAIIEIFQAQIPIFIGSVLYFL